MSKQRATKEEAETTTPPPDPFEMWRKFYEANETAWTKAAQETTSSEAFAEMQGRMLETFLAFQKGARDAMNTQLATLNLPSRDDVARLGELILGLEEKIDLLDDRVATMAGKQKPAASSARPKTATQRKRRS
jgi:polyhydroxyalkanoic acid synthase PhaR subunit